MHADDSPFEMSNEGYEHQARLRQEALDTARKSGADYFFVSKITMKLIILYSLSLYLTHSSLSRPQMLILS